MNATAFSPDGTQIATASGRGPGVVWVADIETGDVRELTTGLYGFTSVAWSPDGRYVAAGGWESDVSVWDTTRDGPRPRYLLKGHTDSAHWLDWSPDRSPNSSALVTGSDDGTARIWKITDQGASEVMTLAQGGRVSGVAYSGDGTHVMVGSETSAAKIWDVGPFGDAEWANVPDHGDVTFARSGSELITSSVVDGRVRVTALDIDTGEQRSIGSVRAYGGSPDVTRDLSPDGASIAITYGKALSHDLSVRDVATNDELFALDDVEMVDWSPDGEYLAVGSRGYVSIYDRSGHELDPLMSGDAARFGPRGVIAIFGENKAIIIWDWHREEVLETLSTSADRVVFDPTGERIVTDDLEIWDVASEEISFRLSYPSPQVTSLAFSPDGARLAVGIGNQVLVLDARSGAERLVLRGSAAAGEIVFSPDGSMLASTSKDGTRVWALDIDDLLEIAHHNVTRSLSDEECRKYHVPACSDT